MSWVLSFPDDIREIAPKETLRKGAGCYWIWEGKVYFLGKAIRGVHIPSFRFYLGGFAKDRKNCYCHGTRLAGGNGKTFRALNLCYVTDGNYVWTVGGKVKDADAESFEVCDDGFATFTGAHRIPNGYGKDKSRVYYYDYDGKPNWVRKANAASFQSLNDGKFGRDSNFVFRGAATIPKAKVEHWKKIGGNYSRDHRKIFYSNREIRGADHSTFEVVSDGVGDNFLHLAKDKNHYYKTDKVIEPKEFAELLGGVGL